jgi:hypothetical protein
LRPSWRSSSHPFLEPAAIRGRYDLVIGANGFLAVFCHQPPPSEDQARQEPKAAGNIADGHPGCIVSATTASFCSVVKRRRRTTSVMISTLENVLDIVIAQVYPL